MVRSPPVGAAGAAGSSSNNNNGGIMNALKFFRSEPVNGVGIAASGAAAGPVPAAVQQVAEAKASKQPQEPQIAQPAAVNTHFDGGEVDEEDDEEKPQNVVIKRVSLSYTFMRLCCDIGLSFVV
jgi:hypothetical protein